MHCKKRWNRYVYHYLSFSPQCRILRIHVYIINYFLHRKNSNHKYSESWNTHLKVYTHCKFLNIVLFVSKQGGRNNPHSPSISIWPRTVKLFRCWFVRVTVFCIPQLGEDSDNTPSVPSVGVGKILLRKPSQLVKSYIIFDYLRSAPSTVNVVQARLIEAENFYSKFSASISLAETTVNVLP